MFYTSSKEHTISSPKVSLINWISLIFQIYSSKVKPFPHFIDKNKNRLLINLIFDSFRRIDDFNLEWIDFDLALEYLIDARDL